MLKKNFWTYQSAVAGAAVEISKPKTGKHTLEQFRAAVFWVHVFSIIATTFIGLGVIYFLMIIQTPPDGSLEKAIEAARVEKALDIKDFRASDNRKSTNDTNALTEKR